MFTLSNVTVHMFFNICRGLFSASAVTYCVVVCMRKFVNYIAHARVEQQVQMLL